MLDNWNYGPNWMIVLSIALMFVLSAASESARDSKETPISSENALEADNDQHTIGKRAWKQMSNAWGKRSLEDESLEDLHRKLMQIYSEQLMANKVDGSEEYAPEEFDLPNDKRAWKQMSNAWGKRDWSQLRGNGWGKRDSGNWNNANMRGLWGKRNPAWGKLSSAWGK